ncbi:putative phosphatidylinositol 3-kinase [Helianthus annuus]|nr:putative phosphatidylinositol 3-kinase [Helianthus annuus]
MGRWEMIDVCDALELLSPVFGSEEVRAHAVRVLKRADDEELQCFYFNWFNLCVLNAQINLVFLSFSYSVLGMGAFDGGDGFKLWQSLVRQTELTAQPCSITRDVRNVPGGTQKKIEKLWHLLSGLLSELTYFEEVIHSRRH